MNWSNLIKLTTLLMATLLMFLVVSCGTTNNADDEMGDLTFSAEKSGAILWGENCSRCHNAPDPSAFSDVQWEAIGTHMRIRGGLTAEEARKIVKFLQQGN